MAREFPFPEESIIDGSIEIGSCITAGVDPYNGLFRIEAWCRGMSNDDWYVPGELQAIELDAAAAARLAPILARYLADKASARATCPGREHPDHVGDVCEGECCTSCGGPIDENSECRCG